MNDKVELLQKTKCKVDYKDFESCYRIYTKPLGVVHSKAECLKEIEYVHKKNFGEELSKEGDNLMEEIR